MKNIRGHIKTLRRYYFQSNSIRVFIRTARARLSASISYSKLYIIRRFDISLYSGIFCRLSDGFFIRLGLQTPGTRYYHVFFF